jgi:hypothetical protein
VSVAGAAAYMINFAKPTHLLLYGPAALLEEGRPAADAFLGQVRHFREFIAFEAFRNCELVLRALSPDDGALAAALVALDRGFSICPSDDGVTRSRTQR